MGGEQFPPLFSHTLWVVMAKLCLKTSLFLATMFHLFSFPEAWNYTWCYLPWRASLRWGPQTDLWHSLTPPMGDQTIKDAAHTWAYCLWPSGLNPTWPPLPTATISIFHEATLLPVLGKSVASCLGKTVNTALRCTKLKKRTQNTLYVVKTLKRAYHEPEDKHLLV